MKGVMYIKLSHYPFKKKDLITTGSNKTMVVLNVCKPTWWRKLFTWFGFDMKIGYIKVKPYEFI